MRNYALSIDPGMSNGICLFSFGGDEEPFRQEALWQFRGGAMTLNYWLDRVHVDKYKKAPGLSPASMILTSGEEIELSDIVVEKFTPRGGPGFSLTQASAEPLRGEGVLIGRGLMSLVRFQDPAAQYFMGGKDLPDRKKRSREFLKLHGLYVTGKTLGQPDADDAISAELHAISWLRKARHMPTLVELFQEEEGE